MADYISRDAVLALETDLHFDRVECVEQLKHWRCHHIDPIEVKILPAADVRPVVRGHFTHDGSEWTNRWICSECGYKWFFTKAECNFCPNCGADMREVKADG